MFTRSAFTTISLIWAVIRWQPTRIVSAVIKTFLVDIPLAILFNSPTVADMAAAISAHMVKSVGEAEIARILAELEALTDEEAQQLVSAGVSKARHE